MNPGSNVELAFVTVAIDRLTLDVLEHKVGLSAGGYACVQQLSDIGIGKAGKDRAFSFESLLAALPNQTGAQELHCRFALESPIIAFGKPHRPHAALANCGDQAVSAHSLSGKPFGLRPPKRTLVQKPLVFRGLVVLEELVDLAGEDRVLCVQRLQLTNSFLS